jgi:serine/threonine protein kinase
MEWVHCHVARNPESPKAVLDAIPSQLSAIDMKLLAKTADDRYQTAAGLEHDLRRCLAQFEGFISTLQVRASDSGDQEL